MLQLVNKLKLLLILSLWINSFSSYGQTESEHMLLPNGQLIQINSDSTWEAVPIITNYTMDDGRVIELFVNHTWLEVRYTTKIGDQEWMLANLDVEHFQDGTPILQVTNFDDWEAANESNTPAWCYYDFNPEFGPVYGKLYNWYAVADARNLAPTGWKIPTDAEWSTLKQSAGTNPGVALSNQDGWRNTESIATNQSGFSALPGGMLEDRGVKASGPRYTFKGVETLATFWTSDEASPARFYGVSYIIEDIEIVSKDTDYSKKCGMSVRLLKIN